MSNDCSLPLKDKILLGVLPRCSPGCVTSASGEINLKFEGDNLKSRAFQSTKRPVAKQLVAPWSRLLLALSSCSASNRSP